MTVKIDTSRWQRLKKVAQRFGRREVHVGIFEGTIAKIGAVHEFGTSTVPERSFMRSAMQKGREQLDTIMKRIGKLVFDGKLDENKALTMLGVWGRNAMKQRIREQPPEWPPLAPATIKRKGPRKNKMLIDTAQLINSITYKLVGFGASATDAKSAARSVGQLGRKR